ncbi:MAG: nucleotide exchange factor GrpE [Oscillospiraceae bacterium]|nr:nucleotide exchange factor GrpE [Oscillospiraceae bacterium]
MENSESKDLEQTAQAEEVPAEETVEADEAAEQSADDKLAAELAQVKDQLLRTMAEYDNHRKRTAKEKLELRADIITNVVADFLPVMDNLERALQAECSDENYKQGVQMIYDSFMATLTKLGVTEIESDGAEFNPQLHQAVQRVDDESVESGRVAKTFAKGYKINDKVIRFAMVAVAN